MSALLRRLIPVAAVAILLGCYPDRDDNDGNYDVVATATNPSANFATITTFSIQDSVIHLVPPEDQDDIDRTFDDFMIERTRQNLLALGWSEIVTPTAGAEPDVVVQVGATSSTYIGYVYDWWAYWGYWWGWGYGPGWDVLYPGAIIPYSFTTGSVILQMADLRTTDPTQPGGTIPMIWLAGINGLLDGASDPELQLRIGQGIDQAFEQTPEFTE